MLVHLLVASLAASTVAFRNEMVVLETSPLDLMKMPDSFTLLVPNHAKRTRLHAAFFSGTSHSIDMGEESISVNCKAGSDTECHCSMKVSEKASTLTKPCRFDLFKSKRDEQGNCLLIVQRDVLRSFKESGTCYSVDLFSKPVLPNALKFTQLLKGTMFSVPKGNAIVWGATVGTEQKAISIKCANNDECDCSIAPLYSEEFATCPFEKPERMLPKRDILGHCRVVVTDSTAPGILM